MKIILLALPFAVFNTQAQSYIDSTSSPVLPYIAPSSADSNQIKWQSGFSTSFIVNHPNPEIELPPVTSCKKVTLVLDHDFSAVPSMNQNDTCRYLSDCEAFVVDGIGEYGNMYSPKVVINRIKVQPTYIGYSYHQETNGDDYTKYLTKILGSQATFDICPGQSSISIISPRYTYAELHFLKPDRVKSETGPRMATILIH